MSHGIVSAWRGEYLETEHRIHAAICDPSGRVLAGAGDRGRITLFRSCAKPFQALPLFERGAVARFGLEEADLALVCASHDGTEIHVDRARGILGKLGLSAEALRCGAHPPLGGAAGAFTVLNNNCSGKHAGMLASCLAAAEATERYEAADHPLQRRIRAILAELLGTQEPGYGVDGCSVPTFALRLDQMAHLYALLLAPENAPRSFRDGLRALADAMRAYPELVGGEGVLDTRLMRAQPGLIAKRGADGLYAMAAIWGSRGPVGVAVKVEDGCQAARSVAVVAILDAMGCTRPGDALEDARRPVRRNHRGLAVGHFEARIELREAG